MALDIRHHPRVNKNSRRIAGLDGRGGFAALNGSLIGFLLGMIVYAQNALYGLLVIVSLISISYAFARKFIHQKPPRYFNDWIESKRTNHFTPFKK